MKLSKIAGTGAGVISFVIAYGVMRTVVHNIAMGDANKITYAPTTTAPATASAPAEERLSSDKLIAALHDAQVDTANQFRSTLPRQIDADTVLKSVRAEGAQLIYTYEITAPSIDPANGEVFREGVSKKVCGDSDMRKIIGWGGSYGYEYWHEGNYVYHFVITKCA